MASILVVDDSLMIRKLLVKFLIDAKHTVVGEAGNGETAYREYVKHKPDIVTMDVSMPEVNGIEAVKKIIGEFPGAKIIMISAINQKDMVYQALQYGAKDYLIKPITKEKVVKVVDETLKIENEGAKDKGVDDKLKDIMNLH